MREWPWREIAAWILVVILSAIVLMQESTIKNCKTENHDLQARIVEMKHEVNHNAKMALDMFPRSMTDSIGVYYYQDVEEKP